MKAAETAGIKVGGVMMKAMLFSGALAGLCGAVHVTSVGTVSYTHLDVYKRQARDRLYLCHEL